MSGDWRLTWYSGQCALLEGEFDKAAADFDDRAGHCCPASWRPKLAIAATAELRDAARRRPALLRDGLANRPRATSAPPSGWRGNVHVQATGPARSPHWTRSPRVGVLHRRGHGGDRDPARRPDAESLDEQTLLDAGRRAAALTLESTAKRATIRLRVLGAALGWLQAGHTAKTPRLLGADFDEPGIRTGMERCYRELAHETPGMWERIALVEKANAIRPRTRV